MADILPKLKYYLFLTGILVIINMGIFACKQTIDIMSLLASVGTSFIPFAGLITLFVFPGGLPVEFLAFAGVVIGVVSGILTYMLSQLIIADLPFFNN